MGMVEYMKKRRVLNREIKAPGSFFENWTDGNNSFVTWQKDEGKIYTAKLPKNSVIGFVNMNGNIWFFDIVGPACVDIKSHFELQHQRELNLNG